MKLNLRLAKGLALPFALSAALVTQSCGRDSGFSTAASVAPVSDRSGQGVAQPPVSALPPALQAPDTPLMPLKVPPLWEEVRPNEGATWTQFAAKMVLTEAPDLMKGTADVQMFCPSYARLSTDDKVNFWVYLISAVVKYESAFSPTSRMRETGLGTDTVTGQHVYSEGLLQLSYQDGQNYAFCNEFDWRRDKDLNPTDPHKTILDPIKNLRCGIRILNKVIGRHNLIAFDSGHYWSTLMPKHSPEHSIRALTSAISICK